MIITICQLKRSSIAENLLLDLVMPDCIPRYVYRTLPSAKINQVS
jgi:hypothetical protein